MGYPRHYLVPGGSPGIYHCVSRCVRRAFLCGADSPSGRSFEHRRGWIEQRLLELASHFAVAVHAYAVMSNHVHVVVEVDPGRANEWSDDEVAARWVRLFPSANEGAAAQALRVDRLVADAARIAVLRRRLGDLSWFMRCLNEPIARRANAEDDCTGRFWEGRFRCQALLDDTAMLAAMAYVELNPIRAGMTDRLGDCVHTSIRPRVAALGARAAAEPLQPAAGRSRIRLGLSLAAYVDLVEFTSRQYRPGKRGQVSMRPSSLDQIGLDDTCWMAQLAIVGVRGIRAIGSPDALARRALELGQRWLRGITTARRLSTA